jgi:uncharacterized protein (DUF2147 family)
MSIGRPLLLTLALVSLIARADHHDGVAGFWLTAEGDGWIELTVHDGELRGRIAGSPDDPDNLKPSRLDTKNPDPALRDRALLGLTILSGFRYAGDDKWTDGRVYDPNSGKTYRGTIEQLGPDTLTLRGFIGIALFGRTETWTRRRISEDNSH